MSTKKKIPCRVCGKLFEPCSYCQSHADVFRWRNFACSRECAAKYINDTIAYRESLKQNSDETYETIKVKNINAEIIDKKSTTTKKRCNRKIQTENTEIKNNETE